MGAVFVFAVSLCVFWEALAGGVGVWLDPAEALGEEGELELRSLAFPKPVPEVVPDPALVPVPVPVRSFEPELLPSLEPAFSRAPFSLWPSGPRADIGEGSLDPLSQVMESLVSTAGLDLLGVQPRGTIRTSVSESRLLTPRNKHAGSGTFMESAEGE